MGQRPGVSPDAPHDPGWMADEILVKSILIYGLVVGVYLSWLAMAGFLVVALRRLGSGWSRDQRLWTRLKILQHAWLLLFVSMMLLGLPDWVALSMVIVWVALVGMGWMIGRRLPEWPSDAGQPG